MKNKALFFFILWPVCTENVFKLNIDSVKKELSKKLNVNTFDQIYYNIKQNIYRISNRLNIITRVEHNYTPDEKLKMVYFINTDNATNKAIRETTKINTLFFSINFFMFLPPLT